MTIAASADTNPDATRQARLPSSCASISCKTDAAFNGADFFALFDDDRRCWGRS